MNIKAQTWIFDYLAAFLMFFFLLVISISLLSSIDAKSMYDDINREVDLVSNSLMSEGFPVNWNSSSVILPGLLKNNRLDYDKLDEFDSLGYSRSKALFHVRGDYLFYFKNSSGIMNVSGKCFRGYELSGCSVPDVSVFAPGHTDRAWTERIILVDSQIVSMVVVAWR